MCNARICRLRLTQLPYVVSAGFDAAMGDNLGECRVSPAGFAHMTNMLMSLCGGRIVVALEVSSFRLVDRSIENFACCQGRLQSGSHF